MGKKLDKLKRYYDYFVKNKLLKTALIYLFFMSFVIIYNFFCYTIGLEMMQLNLDNVKKIFALELICTSIYTYIGHILMLFFMEEKSNYKSIMLICLPVTIVTMFIVSFSNEAIMNIFIIFFYFFYRWFKHPGKKVIFTTLGYLLLISIIQIVFYYFKYYIFNLQYGDIHSDVVRAFINCDYYLFLSAIIIVKNIIMVKKELKGK